MVETFNTRANHRGDTAFHAARSAGGASSPAERSPSPQFGLAMPGMSSQWLLRALDELDHGIVIVGGDGRVLHLNHVAQSELDGDHPLRLLDGELRARDGRDALSLREALQGAMRGLRRMFAVGGDAARMVLAVVPLEVGGAGPGAALVNFSKRRMCEELSVEGFARCHGLTMAETQVLKGLCAGVTPQHVANEQGVKLSTVRTQISSVRAKTGAASIRALVKQVAQLPPMVGALRRCND